MPEFLQNLYSRVGGARQLAFIAFGVIAMGVAVGVWSWANRTTMVTLLENVPTESVSKMTVKLTELAIPYELGADGRSIRVDSMSYAKARVELAGAGLVDTGPQGLDIFDKPSWGMTDFTQKINLRRGLEGALERNISRIANVKSVSVHLALEDDQIFKQNERPTKASLTLTMVNGTTPSEATVAGIQRLVAGAVGGLTPDNVTIVDERGQALTLDDPTSITGLTSRQLAQQHEVEKDLKKKVEQMLLPTYGEGNARVQVSAVLNFDRVERKTQSIDPDKQALTSEAKQDVTPSAPTQGAAFNITNSQYDYQRGTENYVAAVGGIRKITVAVLIADQVTLPVLDTSAQAQAAAPTPPVITKRTAEELARADTLVRTAVGADPTRGDVISVVSAPFYMPPPSPKVDAVPPPTLVTKLLANPKPVVAIAALLVVLVIAVLMLGALRPKNAAVLPEASTTAELNAASEYAALPASSQMMEGMQPSLQSGETGDMQLGEGESMDNDELESPRRRVVLPPVPMSEDREQAIATVLQRPDAARRVAQAWLRDER